MISITISGCSSKQDGTSQNSDQKILIETFIEYYNKGDADSVICQILPATRAIIAVVIL